MLEKILFLLVVFFSNIIQGITGFAGTILAMPFSIMLVGYETARPVLNFLGLLAGIFFMVKERKHIVWKELIKILCFMTAGMIFGFFVRSALAGEKRALMLILGGFVIVIAVTGLYRMLFSKKGQQEASSGSQEDRQKSAVQDAGQRRKSLAEGNALPEQGSAVRTIGETALLLAAGLIHGIFVSGGPLLISYLSVKVKTKEGFKATISSVWAFLNGIIFVTDLFAGVYTASVIRLQALSIPIFTAGLLIGTALYARMSQRFFKGLTYVLLLVAGVMSLV